MNKQNPKPTEQQKPDSRQGDPNKDKERKPKKSIVEDIEKLKNRREERKKNDDAKKAKNDDIPQQHPQSGKSCDVDFELLIKKKRAGLLFSPDNYTSSDLCKLFVCVRKRPITKKELSLGEIDCVSAFNPRICVHECKFKIDGITKYIDDNEFLFDNVFGESANTTDVYRFSVSPTINLILNRGLVTCFAYGQTGSGKTYTMRGIQNQAIDALFKAVGASSGRKLEFYVSFFEIYGGRLYDLLNGKNKLSVMEDKNQKVQIFGLEEKPAATPDEMRDWIDLGNAARTTHNTVTNEVSSRSHAICNIVLKEVGSNDEYGKLSLVDLAGSERAQETQSNDRQRRAEGAEINKSLLALKECIRALDAKKTNSETHVPFRASKLTLVLRDSFVSKSDKSRIIMIACVSPGYSSANHTINTLRYSDRLKEKTSTENKNVNNMNQNQKNNWNLQMQNVVRNNDKNEWKNEKNDKNEKNEKNEWKNEWKNEPKIEKFEPKNEAKHEGKNNNNFNRLFDKIKEMDDINMHDFNLRDDNLLDNMDEIDDKFLKADKFITPEKQGENEDWEYLKKTVQAKDGKYLSDEFIKYHQVTEKIIEDEDEIVNSHMNIIKEDAKLLTEEGELITNVKGVGEAQFEMEVYAGRLEKIISQKISMYLKLKGKIESYKQHIKEEDEIRKKINPEFFADN